jgi:hypothetical protein
MQNNPDSTQPENRSRMALEFSGAMSIRNYEGGSHCARRRLFARAAKYPRVLAHAKGALEAVTLYQVSTPIPQVHALSQEPVVHTHEPVIHTNTDSRRP